MSLETDMQFKRLCATYAEKGDEELLQLDEQREDLTELAQEALAQVMKDRGLEREATAVHEVDPGIDSNKALDELGLDPNEDVVCSFSDAFRANEAIRIVTEAGISCWVVDLNKISPERQQDGRYLINLGLVTDQADKPQALKLLERLVNVLPPEGNDSFEELAGWEPVGMFLKEDGLVVARALADNGFSYIWDDYNEGAVESDPNVQISVKAERVKKAMRVVEAVVEGLPER